MGTFNAYNLLAVYSAAKLLGETESQILPKMSELTPVSGRFERITGKTGITGIVDFAHTPDALQKILEATHQIKQHGSRLITVLGCGGDRDKEKRPIMGAMGFQQSDELVLTSDNPRTEDPMAILRDMQMHIPQGQEDGRLHVIPNRRDAIKFACTLGREGDIILVAGKGHETYQEVQGVRQPFSDQQCL